MAAKFYNSAGTDLDTIYDLAPAESYSVFNRIIGLQVDVQAHITSVDVNQLYTDNGVKDLLKRYLWKDYGTTQATSGFYFTGNAFESGTNQTWDEPFALHVYAAKKGSAGGVPTWSSLVTAAQPAWNMTVASQTRQWAKSGAADTGGFPVTSYTIVSSSISTSNQLMGVGMTTGYPIINGGGCTISLDVFADDDHSTTVTVDVVMKAHNIIGSSSNRTYRFTIPINGAAVGGGPCFATDTQVLLEDGSSTRIDSISNTDVLASYSEESMIDESVVGWESWRSDTLIGHLSKSKVKKITKGTYSRHYIINGSLRCTHEHPFLTYRDQVWSWIRAENLISGDECFTSTESNFLITSVVRASEPLDVVSLDVETIDNYYVLLDNTYVLVHNALGK